MPTSDRTRTLLALLGLFVGVSGVLAGCTPGGDEDEPAPTAASAPPDTVAALTAALERRAAAVRDGDAAGFLAGLVTGDRELRRQQRTYFETLAQLPLGVFEYSLDPTSVVRAGEDHLAVVELRSQLSGFDERVVHTYDRMRFTPAGSEGAYAVAAAVDPAWEAEHDVHPQPWDLGPVEVRSVPGVLGVFDEETVGSADRLLLEVARGVSEVSASVPFDWNRAVVVHALSDPGYLATLPALPGGDPATLDGVAFPVPARPGEPVLAATRFALHPRLLPASGGADPLTRSRLVRHELTHVALGRRDDHVPVWLSEGLAEYVSVRPVPAPRRGVSRAALDAARGGFDDLPGDAEFNDADSAVHYGQSWWACEYLATSFGEPTLWSLLDALGDPDLDEAGRNLVLQQQVGLGTRQLAHRAGRLLLHTFDPAPPTGPPDDAAP